jgi:dTDP-L-rhamnose 4-epimerase
MRALNRKSPILYEDGQQLRDYVYVGDVVEANLLVLESDAANGQVFNVAGMRPVTVEELAQLIVAASGTNVEPEIAGVFRFGDTRHTVSDASKLCALGWKPKTPVETIVEEYVGWVRTQPDWRDVYEQAEREMAQAGVIRQSQRMRGL